VLWDELSGLTEATTGMRLDRAQLEVLANHITNRTRQYNRREGLDSSTDTLPKRFLTEATDEGAVLTAEELETMVGEYNAIRGSG
jgi:aldehyde:ferredoxin oxidoreductase